MKHRGSLPKVPACDRVQNLNLLGTKIQGTISLFLVIDRHTECLLLPWATRSSRKIAAVISLMDRDMSWACSRAPFLAWDGMVWASLGIYRRALVKDGSLQYKYGTDVRHCVIAEQLYQVFFWTKEISRHSSCNILINYSNDCDKSHYSNLDRLELSYKYFAIQT